MVNASRLPPLLVAAALLSGCATPAVENGPGSVTWAARSFQHDVPGCGDAEKAPHPCVAYRVSWPEVLAAPAPQARERMNAAIAEALRPAAPAASWEEEARLLAEAFEEFQNTKFDNEASFYHRRIAEIVRNNSFVLSVSIAEYRYTGGAFPEFRQNYLNFDPATGGLRALASLLAPGADSLLRRYSSAGPATPYAPAPEGLYFLPDPARPAMLVPWSQAAALFPPRSPLVPRPAR